jgi:hypothetical protein
MARWRHAVELAMIDETIGELTRIRPREPKRRAEWRGRKCCSGTLRSRRSTRWDKDSGSIIRRCSGASPLAYGPPAALDDRPQPGKEPTITPEAKA